MNIFVFPFVGIILGLVLGLLGSFLRIAPPLSLGAVYVTPPIGFALIGGALGLVLGFVKSNKAKN